MKVDRDILNNLCLNITDGEHGTIQNDNDGRYFLLSNKNIINGQIIISDADRRINKESFSKINKRTKLENGDLVISTVGVLGKLAIIKAENLNYDFQRSVGIIKCDEKKINTKYLYYYLNTQFVQNRLNHLSKGAVQKCLFISDLKNLEIDFPDLPTQQKIASVLSALDDKIELNNRINAELEAMAKTLYDYWFVQFDFPTHSHCEERGTRDEAIHNKKIASLHEVTLAKTGYKSSGGKMVYNETLKREIPEGWEVKSLYEIADYINGLACQKFRPENENDDYLPVIKIREMNEGKSNNTERARINIPEKNIINDGDVLFAWSASLDVKIWTEGKGALNQHIFKVVSKDFPRSFYYFELLNYLKHFKMMAELRKTTMGHITIDHLKTSYISIPPKNLIEKLDKKLNILIEKIIINQKQNQELSALRDWLLPMLMNGQVKVG